jgi:hypothetical protein
VMWWIGSIGWAGRCKRWWCSVVVPGGGGDVYGKMMVEIDGSGCFFVGRV